MPGYDFYEFYQSVMVAGNSEQAYNMAFQMAKTLDKTITPQKLTHDAEFYISKINEVHSQYTNQGQTKLNSIQEKKAAEKSKLNSEIDQASTRIAQIKVELAQLEGDINTKRAALGKIDDTYFPQEKAIKEKLSANDFAQKTSIDKLNIIKEGILKFIKG
jgi:predicted  nucleic acid-binding Zn-ribbon protein